MKTRNGFVSNSSSSSFIIVCTQETFDTFLKKADPFYRAWVKQYLSPQKQIFLGEKVVLISAVMSSEDPYDLDGWKGKIPKEAIEDDYTEGEEEPFIDGAGVMSAIENHLKKISKDVIIGGGSC